MKTCSLTHSVSTGKLFKTQVFVAAAFSWVQYRAVKKKQSNLTRARSALIAHKLPPMRAHFQEFARFTLEFVVKR